MKRPSRSLPELPLAQSLADLCATMAPAVVKAVVEDRKHLGQAVSAVRGGRARLAHKDYVRILPALAALLRWRGWIEPLQLRRPEENLLLAWLLDATELSGMARAWATRVGRDPATLFLAGGAPGWTGRAEGLKRWCSGRPVNADPWRLFPDWLRNQLPVPPGGDSAKARRLSLLYALQSNAPLWMGVRTLNAKSVWNELREAGIKPWIHRRLETAAKLPAQTDLSQLEAILPGRFIAEDLSSQAVGIVCDPDPGERWWSVRGEGGHHAMHLAALMQGKGAVIATFDHERRRHDVALRLRRGGYHNVSTRIWDGRHPPGKPASFDGVVVDAVCSGVGSWRRHPDARWVISADQIPALAAGQLQYLDTASASVRPGGTLVYTALTVTRAETIDVVSAFLTAHPEFSLQPFPHPLDETTTQGTLQLWPQIHDADARFVAKMVRAMSDPTGRGGGSTASQESEQS
jgi:16S rRNA (cytosine967-C5)-methyltransferase